MKNKLGCAIIALVISLVMVIVGIFLMNLGGNTSDEAELVADLTPSVAQGIARGSNGQRVVVLGTIDPDTRVVESKRGLAMYLKEEYVVERSGSGGNRRTSRSWKDRGSELPPFTLRAQGGSVSIVNQGYELLSPSFSEPGRAEDGALRYSGFRPGDAVLVDGSIQSGKLVALRVFGGDHAGYVQALQSQASNLKLGGQILLALGALPLLAGLGFLIFLLRQPRSTIQAQPGVDYSNLSAPQQPMYQMQGSQSNCPSCGAILADNPSFCGNCGRQLR